VDLRDRDSVSVDLTTLHASIGSRASHSSTFQLDLSTVVWVKLGGVSLLVTKTAQVNPKSGEV
jgi:hypothetical protein